MYSPLMSTVNSAASLPTLFSATILYFPAFFLLHLDTDRTLWSLPVSTFSPRVVLTCLSPWYHVMVGGGNTSELSLYPQRGSTLHTHGLGVFGVIGHLGYGFHGQPRCGLHYTHPITGLALVHGLVEGFRVVDDEAVAVAVEEDFVLAAMVYFLGVLVPADLGWGLARVDGAFEDGLAWGDDLLVFKRFHQLRFGAN